MGPRPHLSFCTCKTSWLASPRPHQWYFAFKTATLAPEFQVSTAPCPHMSFCACKTKWLAWDLLVSMGARPHLWFLHAKQRPLDQNYKSLWVPDFACWFVNANSVLTSTMTLVYRSQPSSVVLCIQSSAFSKELLVSMDPSPHLWFLQAKQGL